MIKKIARRFIIFTAWAIILATVLVTLLRLLVPILNNYQEEFSQWATSFFEQPVTIGEIEAGWDWFEPVVRFNNVVIFDTNNEYQAISIEQFEVNIDLIGSWRNKRLEPSSIKISGAKIALYENSDGSFNLVGFSLNNDSEAESQIIQSERVLSWLLSRKQLLLTDINFSWKNDNGMVFVFSDLQLAFSRRGNHHHINGFATLAENQETKLAFNAELITQSNQYLLQQGKFYLSLQNALVEPWLTAIDFSEIKVEKGQGDINVWADWFDGDWLSVASEVSLNDLQLSGKNGEVQQNFNQVSGRLVWQQSDNNSQKLLVDNLVVRTNNCLYRKAIQIHSLESSCASEIIQWPTQEGYVKWQTNSGTGLTSSEFYVDVFALENMKLFIELIPELEQTIGDSFEGLQPKGLLQKLNGRYQSQKDFSFTGKMQQLKLEQFKSFPGVVNLNGQFDISAEQGYFRLYSEQSSLDMNYLFREELPIDKLEALLAWQYQMDGWHGQLSGIEIKNQDVTLVGHLDFLLPDTDESPSIDLSMKLLKADMSEISRYLPVAVMDDGLVSWLDESIKAGKVENGEIIIQGRLSDFPFEKGSGLFQINTVLKDAEIDYFKTWPKLEKLQGTLHLHGQSLAVKVNEAQLAGMPVEFIEAKIPTLAEDVQAELFIKGVVKGDLAQGLDIVQASPLSEGVKQGLRELQGKGPLTLDLGLYVPLENDEPVKIKGDITLNKNELQLPDWNLKLDSASGNLLFTEDSFTADNVKASFFGKQVNLKISTLPAQNDLLETHIAATGAINIADISGDFLAMDLPATGITDYQVLLRLRDFEDPRGNTLTIESKLNGVEIKLPQPLAKKATEIKPLRLDILFNESNRTKLNVHYSDILRGGFLFRTQDNQELTFQSGRVQIGKGVIEKLPGSGLSILAQMDTLDVSEWTEVISGITETDNTQDMTWAKNNLKEFRLELQQLFLFEREFNTVKLNVEPMGEVWHVSIVSPNIDGELWVPLSYPEGVISGDFKRLHLDSSDDDKKTNSMQIKDIPALALTSDDFRYNNKRLGGVALKLTPIDDYQLRIESLRAQTPAFDLMMEGIWQQNGANHFTQIEGELRSNDLEATLTYLDMPALVKGNQGSLKFALNWPGELHDIVTEKLNGDLFIKLGQGVISELSEEARQKIGLGQILTLFSLSSLSKRLRLDFSDLTEKGFSFDVMEGNFVFRDGLATTTNAYINGTVAEVKLTGDIDLKDSEYDLLLTISPHVTSSLPIVATVVGGPIVGALTWAADKLVGSKLQQQYYQVKGPWDKPDISQVTNIAEQVEKRLAPVESR